MFASYILPTLDHFNRMAKTQTHPGKSIEFSNSFSLVLFRTSDCIPGANVIKLFSAASYDFS
jgi:hypothetical protein